MKKFLGCKKLNCKGFSRVTNGYCEKHHWYHKIKARMVAAECELPEEGKRSRKIFYHIDIKEFEELWN